jgi:hypothetical protein
MLKLKNKKICLDFVPQIPSLKLFCVVHNANEGELGSETDYAKGFGTAVLSKDLYKFKIKDVLF